MGFVQLWDILANSQIFLKKIEVIKSISQTHSSSLFRPQLVHTPSHALNYHSLRHTHISPTLVVSCTQGHFGKS